MTAPAPAKPPAPGPALHPDPSTCADGPLAPPPERVWRLELKYAVPPGIRTVLARDIRAFCDFDDNADEGGYYTVRSLYLDSPDWGCFYEKDAGTCDRHKLRVRAYPDRCGHVSSVKFEIKYRGGERISKDVGTVTLADYRRLAPMLASHRLAWPDRSPSSDCNVWNRPDNTSSPALRRFFELKLLHARLPVLCLQYRRQAMRVRSDRRVRITIDDRLVSRPTRELLTSMSAAHSVLGDRQSVLEIKTPDRLPYWLRLLIGKYRLHAQSVSKYALAVAAGPFGLENV